MREAGRWNSVVQNGAGGDDGAEKRRLRMRMPNTGLSDVLFGLEEKPPLRVALGAAFQHLLAIFAGIVTPALVVCGL